MVKLIDNILDLQKIEAGKLMLVREKQDYYKFLEECLAFNEILAKEKSITITKKFEKNIPLLEFDKIRILQVINNLLSNALKFSHVNSEILIKVEKVPEFIMTSVVDSGPGIPEMDIPKIFEHFQMGSIQPSEGKKGTGLGLPISKKIIETHNGTLGFETELGKGTSFYFTLPI